MSIFPRLWYHGPRLRHLLGFRERLGSRAYAFSGYHPDRLAYEIDSEPYLLPVLRRIFDQRTGTFLDVGANIGQTLLKVLSLDPARPYVGFEPQLECCFYIEQFLRLNALNNAQVVPIALSDRTAMVPLFRDRAYDDTASVLPTHAYAPNQTRPYKSWVPARTGDQVLSEMGLRDVAVIKIDVEGFEPEVISGLSETLRAQRPFILFEVLGNYFWNKHVEEATGREKSHRANEIYRTLANLRYSIHRIDARGNEHLIDGFDLDTKATDDFANEGRDYVARPLA